MSNQITSFSRRIATIVSDYASEAPVEAAASSEESDLQLEIEPVEQSKSPEDAAKRLEIVSSVFSDHIRSTIKCLDHPEVPSCIVHRRLFQKSERDLINTIVLIQEMAREHLKIHRAIMEQRAAIVSSSFTEVMDEADAHQIASDWMKRMKENGVDFPKGHEQMVEKLRNNDGNLNRKCAEELTQLQKLSEKEASSNSLLMNYLRVIDSPEQRKLFYQRIAKVFTETTFSKTSCSSAIVKDLLTKTPGHPLIAKAILEDTRRIMIENIFLSIKNAIATGDPIWILQARELYVQLPQRDKTAIERQIGIELAEKQLGEDLSLYQSESVGLGDLKAGFTLSLVETIVGYLDPDQDRGRKYLEVCFQSPKEGDLELISYCLITYLEARPLKRSIDLGRFCDESIRQFFFKVKDANNKTRAHLIGTCHAVPAEFLKFRRVVRRALFKANVVMLERDFSLTIPKVVDSRWDDSGQKHGFSMRLGCTDLELFLYARKNGKQMVGLERVEDHDSLENTLEKLVNEDQVPKTPSEWFAEYYRYGKMVKEGNLADAAKDVNFTDVAKPGKAKEYEKVLIQDRNLVQCKSIDGFLRKNPNALAFIGTGIDHLPDTENSVGLLTLLHQKGWKIVQV